MNDRTATVWLGLGSNVDPERHYSAGLEVLAETDPEMRVSPIYRSAAVGFDGNDFLNGVVALRTPLAPLALKAWLNQLEDRHGRRRDVPRWSDRTLDVDILLYDDLVLDHPQLVLPRPEILEFAHVLRPLADLEPDLTHPLVGKTMAELWRDFAGDRDGLVREEPAWVAEWVTPGSP